MAGLAAYRHLLRATSIAFQGDIKLLDAARLQAREGFERSRSLALRSQEATDAVEHAEGVAQVLRQNVVQAKHAEDSDVLKLRIHKDTERGDNESIKQAGKSLHTDQR